MQRIAKQAAALTTLVTLSLVGGCGGGAGSSTGTQDAAADAGDDATPRLESRLETLEQRAARLDDRDAIERLQRAYGYYVDRADWDAVVDLMTDDARVEYGRHGVYAGRDSIRALFYALGGGDAGLELGELNEHVQLQPVIDIAPDGETAQARWRLLGILGRYEEYARWQAGVYENEYRKEDGRWKISRIRRSETFTVPFHGGLTTSLDTDADAVPDLPEPDAPPTFDAASWPEVSLLPFHFEHPVAARAADADAEPAGPDGDGDSVTDSASANGSDSETASASDTASPGDSVDRARQTRDAALEQRAAALAQSVERLEDKREIEILQRTYGYYVDKNLWRQIADLFAADGTLEIGGRGVFEGRDRVLEYLEWLGEPEHGRLYDHTQMQGVITIGPDGRTAKGRWRALVFGGNEGGVSVFGDCIYENEYVKEGGVWKISKLHSYFIMYTNWSEGWGQMGWPNTRPEEELPPDRPPTVVYDMYPGELTAPIHYAHPVTGEHAAGPAREDADARSADAPAQTSTADASADASAATDVATRLDELDRRIERLEDANAVERLHNVYGYYHDARRWDDVAALFADAGTYETAQRGVYVGRDRVRERLSLEGPPRLEDGVMSFRLQYQPVAHVASDGRTAQLRARELLMSGEHEGEARIGGNIYENEYVKENGVWKIANLHRYTTFLADYEAGWAQRALPMPGPSETLPPDRPPSETYEAFPTFYVMPFHYDNPVTGEPPVDAAAD